MYDTVHRMGLNIDETVENISIYQFRASVNGYVKNTLVSEEERVGLMLSCL
jgi:hypothetical protein